MSYIKIQKAYATATYECSVVTNVLSAWISNDKKVVLLGYEGKPTEDGFVKATAEGLLLLSKDLDNIRVLVENLTINDKFESCFSQKQTLDADGLVFNFSSRPQYGRFITIKRGDRFACMSRRRFIEFLGLLGISYMDADSPIFHLPAAFQNVHSKYCCLS